MSDALNYFVKVVGTQKFLFNRSCLSRTIERVVCHSLLKTKDSIDFREKKYHCLEAEKDEKIQLNNHKYPLKNLSLVIFCVNKTLQNEHGQLQSTYHKRKTFLHTFYGTVLTIYFTISGNVYDDMTQDVVTAMTEKALKSGINFIDTAPWYGQGLSEKRLGVALKNIPRDKYFIATKVSETHKTANRGKLFYTIPLTSTCQFTLFQNTKINEFFKSFSNKDGLSNLT